MLIGDGIYKTPTTDANGNVLTISRSGRPEAWITWQAAPGARPELRPTGWGGIVITGSYHVIDGLTVIGGNDSLTLPDALADAKRPRPGARFNTNGILVWDNKTLVPWERTGKLSDGNGILLDVTEGEDGGGATNPNADAVTATKPAKTDRPAKPPRPPWNGRALIANNVSAYNGGSGIHTFRTKHVDIINNTTYWNGQVVGYQELFPNRSDDIVILNNIIVPRPGGKITSNNRNTAIRWDFNLYPSAQTFFKGEHDLVAEPRFIDVQPDLRRADFRLAPTSPGLAFFTLGLVFASA